MSRSIAETLMGALVLAIAAAFVVFAYTRTSVASVDGYELSAKFANVNGLMVGSDVRIGGIKVGSVTKQILDKNTFDAILRFTVDEAIELPTDTTAAVVSDGLLGGKYLSLEPGGADEILQPDGVILYTQSSINIEQLLGKFAFGANN